VSSSDPGASDPDLLEAVVQRVLTGEDADQARAIVGAGTPAEIAAAVRTFVETREGAAVEHCAYVYLSVGLTLELALADGRRCVFKASPARDAPLPELDGALRVQAHLAAHGFPAPGVHAFPDRCAGAHAYLIDAIDRGERVARADALRGAMAEGLARFVSLAATLEPRPPLPSGDPPAGRLWPTPHSVIFDLERTVASAGAIDAIAARAREALDDVAAPPVVAHCDWSIQNLAFRSGALVGVFDWDSVRLVPEVLAVAGAAAFCTQDWRYGPGGATDRFYPGADETLTFVDAYTHARGHPLSADEHTTLWHALVYRLAYQARCEHALDPTREGPAARRLFAFANALG
jgi:hypothetical protein